MGALPDSGEETPIRTPRWHKKASTSPEHKHDIVLIGEPEMSVLTSEPVIREEVSLSSTLLSLTTVYTLNQHHLIPGGRVRLNYTISSENYSGGVF